MTFDITDPLHRRLFHHHDMENFRNLTALNPYFVTTTISTIRRVTQTPKLSPLFLAPFKV